MAAMVCYARHRGWEDAAKALETAGKCTPDAVDPDKGLAPHLRLPGGVCVPALEARWSAVQRLQRQLVEATRDLATAREEVAAAEKGLRGVAPTQAGGLPASASGAASSKGASGEVAAVLPRGPPKFVLAGHRKQVNAVRFHPRFNILASGSEDGSIKTWDADTGELERTLLGHTGTVYDLAFSPDGGYLASASADMSVKVWDFGGGPSGLAASGLEAAGGYSAPPTYACIKTLFGHEHVISGVAWFTRPLRLATCSRDGSAAMWELSTGRCLKRFTKAHTDWVRRVAVNAGSTQLTTCSSDHNVVVWDAATAEPVVTLRGHSNVVDCVDVSTPSMEAALRRALRLPALASATSALGFVTPVKPSAAAARDDMEVAVEKAESAVQVDATTPNGAFTPRRAPAHPPLSISSLSSPVSNLFTSPAAKLFASPLTVSKTAPSVAGSGAPAQPGGAFIVSGGRDKTVRVWDVTAATQVAIFEDHDSWVRGVAFHPCGSLLISVCEDRCIRVLSLESQRVVRTIADAASHFLTCLAMRPPSGAGPAALVTASTDATIQLWECR